MLIEFYNIALNERGLIMEGSKIIPDINIEDISRDYLNSKIVSFLSEQDLDSIKVLQAVMYIGRDYINSDEKKNRNEILNDFIDDLSTGIGWEDKEIGISTLYDKGQLCAYLLDGFNKLDISV